MPAELADVLLVRLDRLDDRTREVVRVASVAGRQVSHELLATVTGLGATDLEAALRSAVESNVLEQARGSSYAFRHALLGEAVYDDLLPGERTRLHTAFSEALQSGRSPAPRPSSRCTPAGPATARPRRVASIEAGNQAFAVGGPHEAAMQFLEALDAPRRRCPRCPTTSTCTPSCAGAPRRSSPPGGCPRRSRCSAPTSPRMPADASPLDRGQVLTSIAAALLLTDTTEDPEAIAAEAVELLADASPRLLARALGVHAQCLGRWNEERARAVAMEGLALAERHNLTGIAVEISTTLISLDDTPDLDRLRTPWLGAAERARAEGHVERRAARALLPRSVPPRPRRLRRQPWRPTTGHPPRRGGRACAWAPFPAEARWMKASVLVDLGRLDEAYDRLDVSGLNPPVVYEWLYFALQITCSVLRGNQAGRLHERCATTGRRDGLIAIVGGDRPSCVRAEQDGDPARAVEIYDHVVETVRPLWHEWFQARLRLTVDRDRDPRDGCRPPVRGRAGGRPPTSYAACSPTANASSTSTPSTTSPAAPSTRPGSRAARPSSCAGGG